MMPMAHAMFSVNILPSSTSALFYYLHDELHYSN